MPNSAGGPPFVAETLRVPHPQSVVCFIRWENTDLRRSCPRRGEGPGLPRGYCTASFIFARSLASESALQYLQSSCRKTDV